MSVDFPIFVFELPRGRGGSCAQATVRRKLRGRGDRKCVAGGAPPDRRQLCAVVRAGRVLGCEALGFRVLHQTAVDKVAAAQGAQHLDSRCGRLQYCERSLSEPLPRISEEARAGDG